VLTQWDRLFWVGLSQVWTSWRAALVFVQPDTVMRWQVLHFHVTDHPTSAWVAQQIVEAFANREAPRYLIRDRDGVYGKEVRRRLGSLSIAEVLTAPQSPWQKDYASHCTSWVPCGTTWFARWRLDSFTPWAFRGGLLPGCSNRQSFLSS
jgi:hypothetical protein